MWSLIPILFFDAGSTVRVRCVAQKDDCDDVDKKSDSPSIVIEKVKDPCLEFGIDDRPPFYIAVVYALQVYSTYFIDRTHEITNKSKRSKKEYTIAFYVHLILKFRFASVYIKQWSDLVFSYLILLLVYNICIEKLSV